MLRLLGLLELVEFVLRELVEFVLLGEAPAGSAGAACEEVCSSLASVLRTFARHACSLCMHTSAYVSIRQHTSAYVCQVCCRHSPDMRAPCVCTVVRNSRLLWIFCVYPPMHVLCCEP